MFKRRKPSELTQQHLAENRGANEPPLGPAPSRRERKAQAAKAKEDARVYDAYLRWLRNAPIADLPAGDWPEDMFSSPEEAARQFVLARSVRGSFHLASGPAARTVPPATYRDVVARLRAGYGVELLSYLGSVWRTRDNRVYLAWHLNRTISD